MEILILLLVVAGVGYWTYRHGKRRGSRLGFRAGRRRRWRGNRFRRRR